MDTSKLKKGDKVRSKNGMYSSIYKIWHIDKDYIAVELDPNPDGTQPNRYGHRFFATKFELLEDVEARRPILMSRRERDLIITAIDNAISNGHVIGVKTMEEMSAIRHRLYRNGYVLVDPEVIKAVRAARWWRQENGLPALMGCLDKALAGLPEPM
jgi:hypothetical protein